MKRENSSSILSYSGKHDYEEKLERKDVNVCKMELSSKEKELVEFQERLILNSSLYNYRPVQTQTYIYSFKATESQTDQSKELYEPPEAYKTLQEVQAKALDKEMFLANFVAKSSNWRSP